MSAELAHRFARAAGSDQRQRQPTTRPFSIRLSVAERQRLEQAAGALPLGTYVRNQLLGVAPPSGVRRRSNVDTAGLGQVLGLLGRSGLSSGLTDLGMAARLGAIDFTPEIEAQITAACADIREVRRLLFRALGLSGETGR